MIFFNQKQVLKIHSSLMDKTGGLDGVRDINLLDSSLKTPFQSFSGNELYPTIIDKAAQLCYSLIENHPFLDGNKRIGVHLALLFLQINQIELIYSQEELISLGLGVASGNINKAGIKDWLSKHQKTN